MGVEPEQEQTNTAEQSFDKQLTQEFIETIAQIRDIFFAVDRNGNRCWIDADIALFPPFTPGIACIIPQLTFKPAIEFDENGHSYSWQVGDGAVLNIRVPEIKLWYPTYAVTVEKPILVLFAWQDSMSVSIKGATDYNYSRCQQILEDLYNAFSNTLAKMRAGDTETIRQLFQQSAEFYQQRNEAKEADKSK